MDKTTAPRALIIAPAWIGDAIMAQPLFARLKAQQPAHLPELTLDALAPPWVGAVLTRMPEISRVIAAPFAHGELALKKRWTLGRELARQGYQRAYLLPNSLKSALVPFFAGIPQRVGFTGEGRYGLVNVRHSLDKIALPLMVERFAQLAEKTPGATLARPVSPPRLISTPEQQAAALKRLGLETGSRPVVFCPGAEYGSAKRWPVEHFATLAQALAARGFSIWLMGSGKDKAVGAAIVAAAALPPAACRNLCGVTRLDEAIDLIAQAALVVCNDSGLMHVAAALARPLVALFGSSSPEFTPPLSTKAEVLSLRLACSPCFERICPLGHLDCLVRLTPDRVLESCLSRLNFG
ncbi:MAG: lipopolysaccharide heptosyltransferase II [Zoogloeaceae bacterium]|jgi:heptosyltransferase-2|nr:lipopolysaccharide heptosyltransferase II [Zoogloeaceae bacterium]